jgi:hypothetical protein
MPAFFHSWKPSCGKKRSRGTKSNDDGFEVVPIEDPGESSVDSGRKRPMEVSVLGIRL